jgi:hypothetical protein
MGVYIGGQTSINKKGSFQIEVVKFHVGDILIIPGEHNIQIHLRVSVRISAPPPFEIKEDLGGKTPF